MMIHENPRKFFKNPQNSVCFHCARIHFTFGSSAWTEAARRTHARVTARDLMVDILQRHSLMRIRIFGVGSPVTKTLDPDPFLKQISRPKICNYNFKFSRNRTLNEIIINTSSFFFINLLGLIFEENLLYERDNK